MARNHGVHVRAFQEYLEALADQDQSPARRSRNLLLSYAELQFKLRGGSQCAVCRASVRHVLPVRVERQDGTQLEYACLCTRCLEAEKAVSRRVSMQIGEAAVEHVGPSQKSGHAGQSPHPDQKSMKKRSAKAR